MERITEIDLTEQTTLGEIKSIERDYGVKLHRIIFDGPGGGNPCVYFSGHEVSIKRLQGDAMDARLLVDA